MSETSDATSLARKLVRQFVEGEITRSELEAQGYEYAKSVISRSLAEGPVVVRNDFDDARLALRSLS